MNALIRLTRKFQIKDYSIIKYGFRKLRTENRMAYF